MSVVDLLPTFCEVAGVRLPDGFKPDGITQVATLVGIPNPKRETPLFWKYDSPWPARKSAPDHWVSYAIVDQQWKLVANQDLSYCELYDIAADLFEKTDLKADKPDVVMQLLGKIADWRKTLPAEPNPACFSAERVKQTIFWKADTPPERDQY